MTDRPYRLESGLKLIRHQTPDTRQGRDFSLSVIRGGVVPRVWWRGSGLFGCDVRTLHTVTVMTNKCLLRPETSQSRAGRGHTPQSRGCLR